MAPNLRPFVLSSNYDPNQPYHPPLTSTATAMRFSAIAKANINAISSAPGHGPGNGNSPDVAASSSSFLTPSASQSRRKSAISFEEQEKDKDEEAKAKAKATIKERAKARLTIDVPSTPRTPRTPKTAEIMAEVDGTLEVLRSNICKLSARGENIEHLEARTEGLVKSAQAFKKSSKRVRREMQWQEYKTRLIIGFVIFFVLTLTIFSIVEAVRNSYYHDDITVDMPNNAASAPQTVTQISALPTATVDAVGASPTPTEVESKITSPQFFEQEPGAGEPEPVGAEGEDHASEGGADGQEGSEEQAGAEEQEGAEGEKWAEGKEIGERDWWWFDDLVD